MPIYEYTCPQCGKKFETLKGMEQRLSAPCPQCNGTSSIVPSMFRFVFYSPFTKDGTGFTTELAHPDKLKELQQENRRK